MKLLFLDFDGVISTYEKNFNFDVERIKLVENLILDTDCKIVVTSDWANDVNNVQEFKSKYFSSKFQNNYSTFVNAIIGITNKKIGLKTRGDEVQHYLNNVTDLESYVILDDVNDFNDDQLFNFIQTDTYEGLTTREVKLCKLILNNNKVISPVRMNNELMFRWLTKNNGGPDKISSILLDYYHRKFF